ncbi:sialate O-acetylesterase [Puia sp.]|uniref:sialate O-acetylesterase n=1 Tax=Puia sp. TaxID=2045100 RepID=UPI002F42ED76
MRKLCLLVFAALGVLPGEANVRLPHVLSSNMVLQQRSQADLWGWCEPGEKIRIVASWNSKVDSVQGSRDGRWKMTLATPAAGGPYTITIKGENTVVLDNILVGEVWVCSGQSNMEMCGNWGLPDIKAELPTCNNPNLRFFRIPRTTSTSPQDDCPGKWTPCDSNELKSFSAAAYFFGKKLNKDLNVPIGLIEAAWGGTPAEVWTPEHMVTGDPVLRIAAEKLQPANGWPYLPGYCYNGMIAPITPFRIAGAIWYQGEGNTANADTYSKIFTAMIASWRSAWNEPLPFYYVQIAPFTYGANNQGTLVREQQAKTMNLENTGMVVVSDLVTDTTDIHPKNKHDVGYRLAGWALAETYHQPGITYKNPTYQTMEIKGDKATLTFTDAPGGLVLKGSEPRELVIAGEDHVFYPAKAKIEGNKLIVSAPAVKKPVAVRYQFDNAGIGNIACKEGLPLAPFRTDDWPVTL